MNALGIMQDSGPDDATRLITVFLGANDALLLDDPQDPKQHVARRFFMPLCILSDFKVVSTVF